MQNQTPPGQDNIPLNHPRRIARIAYLSDFDLSHETEDVRQLCAAHRARYTLPSKLNPEIPRRAMMPEWTEAETAISKAMEAVEKMPGHPLLTDAVILLGRAKDKVADFVDCTPTSC